MIHIATGGLFGAAIDTIYVASGTENYIIDPTSLSFEAIKGNLTSWIKARPDYAVWKDFYDSGAGNTIIELIAGMQTLLGHRNISGRRETYLQYAEMLSSCKGMSQNLGYSANRGTNKHLTLTIVPTSTILLQKYDIVGSIGTYDLIVASDIGIVLGTPIDVEVIIGELNTEEMEVASSDLQQFRFISSDVSEDFRILLNSIEVPVSNVTYDLSNDKYVAVSNAYGAVDVTYLNDGDYNYSSGNILTLEYVKNIIDFVVDIDNVAFNYGAVSVIVSTQQAVEADDKVDIKVNAPLYHETRMVVRGRDDYKKIFKLLNTNFVDTNGYDVSASIVQLTYTTDNLTLLSSNEKNDYINLLSVNRMYGLMPPTIIDPTRLYITLAVTVKLQSPILTATIQDDIEMILTDYEKILATSVDFEEIEHLLEDYSYVKVARIAIKTEEWLASTNYERGMFVTPSPSNETGFIYEATSFLSDVTATLITVDANSIANDESFILTLNDGTAVVFLFSIDDGSVTNANVTISLTSGQTNDEVATSIIDAINSYGGFEAVITSAANEILITRIAGGTANRTNEEDINDSSFSLSDWIGRQSGLGEPNWSLVEGEEVISGDVVFTCRSASLTELQLEWNEFCTLNFDLVIST